MSERVTPTSDAEIAVTERLQRYSDADRSNILVAAIGALQRKMKAEAVTAREIAAYLNGLTDDEWAELRVVRAALPDEATCKVCGCTDSSACEGGCSWVANDLGVDICSACVARLVPTHS